MKNIKALGNENERRICRIIAEFTGAEFKRTDLSGGGNRPGDIYDYTNSTPLSKYTIEIKWHGSEKEFRKKILVDLEQAISQCRADKNWQLIIHLPQTNIDLVIMDLKDYICNDIVSQMQVSKKEAKQIISELESGKRKIGRNIERLKGVL